MSGRSMLRLAAAACVATGLSPLLFTSGAPGVNPAPKSFRGAAASQQFDFVDGNMAAQPEQSYSWQSIVSAAAAMGLLLGLFSAPQGALAGTCKLGACGGMGTAISFTEKEEPAKVKGLPEKVKEEMERNRKAFDAGMEKESKEDRVARQMKKMREIAKQELTYTGRKDVVY
eukprot:TRINITY_DN709_c0_g1_i13.p1 TRINITY_DN709_c0_g1~~TRINITY_DN709_c0_g1_i13.p1  ORF type:complete len:193 (-),score=59.72 TRINITY_DN709_c0_g1_i13:192-707(-)